VSAARAAVATYRLQLSQQFTLRDAARVVPYLADLGISNVYLSPILKARTGSTHGYDVVDPTRINPELGRDAALAALHQQLRRHQMGLLLDIVPNHMAAGSENAWWMDVLEHGPASCYARVFDIDWGLLPGASEKVLLPILGDRFGAVLERGELRLALGVDRLELHYHDHRLPVAIRSYPIVLDAAKEAAASRPVAQRCASVAARIRWAAVTPEVHVVAAQLQDEFAALLRAAGPRRALQTALKRINGRAGRTASFDALESLIDQQHYRLAWWRSAPHLINYRRFFDINDLVGLCVERPEVFAATHGLICSLVEQGVVTGLRIDHIDGLRDPREYLCGLQGALQPRMASGSGRVPVLVEKILSADELLPGDWPVAGTTGYDFLNAVNGIFIHAHGLRRLRSMYAQITEDRRSLADVTYRLQKDVMRDLFRAQVRTLSRQLARLAADDRHACDVAPSELKSALVELTACLPVYRTYIDERGPSPNDRAHIVKAFESATRRADPRRVSAPTLDFVQRVLLLDTPRVHQRAAWQEFVRRWQQFTGAVAAKGVEDTAFYRFAPLVSLNAVGADPEHLTAFVGVERFHGRMIERQQAWPATMNATSTHDSKRSEDVRARINVLSEIPDAWRACLTRWRRWNAVHRTALDGVQVPDANEELFIYQNLLGVWPLERSPLKGLQERFEQFVIKANRESKLHTSWTNPNADYEAALLRFVAAILRRSRRNRFLPDFLRLQQRVAYFGAINSLAQLLVKLTAPGVPDFYQGNELWDFSLVDPDNRRPVDFEARRKALRDIDAKLHRDRMAGLSSLRTNWRDGSIKLFATREGLRLRRQFREFFRLAEYVPLETTGRHAHHVLAFARRHDRQWMVTVVPRCLALLSPKPRPELGRVNWADTAVLLPEAAPGRWSSYFCATPAVATNGSSATRRLLVSQLLRAFPVALLHDLEAH